MRGHSVNASLQDSLLFITIALFVNGTRRDTAVNIPDDPDFWYFGIINANNPISNGGGGSESSIVGTFARAELFLQGKIFIECNYPQRW